ncbi:YtxH domain-containing protein [Bacillus kexueae]|uniref:YtxH domain-containing protein n=1 Tax=Aeribacillus kexueae TaxID=2078952 RepID=UPI001FAF7FB1|nr:YtxH domain-containing protein [Bacillus kexueae]
MGSENKLLKGLFVGAAVGMAIALVDKQTRKVAIEKGKEAADCVKYCAENPEVVSSFVKGKMDEVKTTLRSVSEDITFLNEKVKDLKELTPQVLEFIEETKEQINRRMND